MSFLKQTLNKIGNYINLKRNLRQNTLRKHLKRRRLEIGPGEKRIDGFETLNIVKNTNTDYVADASQKLPFNDETFNIVYSSHALEHIPWFKTKDVLIEWIRIIKKGGVLEIWVPDGEKICEAFVKGEKENTNKYTEKDGWYRYNDEKDNCIWASGRIFTYGDGSGNINHQNWHHALFSKRYLIKLFKECGLKSIKIMNNDQVRGYDHGWINLGIKGIKK